MPRALYYLGLHEAQGGDSAAALERWQELEAQARPTRPTCRCCAPRWRASPRRPASPASRRPPTGMPPAARREQQEAMAALTPEQRQQAIRGMVEGLGRAR